MIRGIHGLFYSSDPEATRARFRDQVKLPGSEVGVGWWIFDGAEGDMVLHPGEGPALSAPLREGVAWHRGEAENESPRRNADEHSKKPNRDTSNRQDASIT